MNNTTLVTVCYYMFQKSFFCCNAIEEPFFKNHQFLEFFFFSLSEKHFNNLKKLSIIKNLLCKKRVPLMLKVLHRTINANKETLCLREFEHPTPIIASMFLLFLHKKSHSAFSCKCCTMLNGVL